MKIAHCFRILLSKCLASFSLFSLRLAYFSFRF